MTVVDAQLKNIAIIDTYFNSLATGDMETFASLFSANVVWHQPGNNKFSGEKHGMAGIGGMVAGMMEESQGTFVVQPDGRAMANGEYVAAPVKFSGSKTISGTSHEIDMKGKDLFRLNNGKIAEVWLFSDDQEAEDNFWDL
ncbi:ketosteroid isomerase [Veronia nyctiphanis]|uniref:Ketosteroid isomerase n=1 Tax=Veronia nyctiphanis TaxID=1278244 RepID=A0A4Q0YMY8_9GAMM|nr:nuclear transport factor 2 family protein [Veronia nyctiphanis]RXJ71745.1 ketosteroid isomerase [Veronia nyctiphanis]